MLALGPYAAPHLPELLAPDHSLTPLNDLLARCARAAATGQYLNFRKTTIYGGSNEMQRNIIAKHDCSDSEDRERRLNFDYSDEQRQLHETLTRCARQALHVRRSGANACTRASGLQTTSTWHTLAEMGLAGAAAARGARRARRRQRRRGRRDGDPRCERLVLEPYLPTVLAARLLADTGTPAQCDRWLPDVAQGRLRLAFAHGEPGTRHARTRVATAARARRRRLAPRWPQGGGGRRAAGGPAGGVGARVGRHRFERRAGAVRGRGQCTGHRIAQLSQSRRATGRRRAVARCAGARWAAARCGRRRFGGNRARARPRRGGGVRRGRWHHAGDERHHAGVPEDAQAVRRARSAASRRCSTAWPTWWWPPSRPIRWR